MDVVIGWTPTARSYAVERYDMRDRRRETLAVGVRSDRYVIEVPEDGDPRPFLVAVRPETSSNGQTTRYGRAMIFPFLDPPALATFRWRARAGLNDVQFEEGVDMMMPTTPKWSDQELNTMIFDAIGFYARYVVRRVSVEGSATVLTRRWTEYMARISEVCVWSNDRWVDIPRSSRRRSMMGKMAWDVNEAQEIVWSHPMRGDWRIRIVGEQPFRPPRGEYDEIDIPAEDWDIIDLVVRANAMLRLAAQTAQLDRWKETGRRDDNPILPVAKSMFAEAEERLIRRARPMVVRRIEV